MTSKTKQFFEKKFSKHIESQVRHYQKLYKFDMPNNSTHNNEADAFKHTFMQAVLALYGTQNFAKFLGDMHERDGNILNSQPRGEEIMDQHNNAQGREIAKEIISQYSWIIKSPATMPFAYNLIAKNVYKRMQQGKIILDPSGRTKLKNHKENLDKHGNTTYEKKLPAIQSAPKQSWDSHGNITGFAVNITEDERQEIIDKYKDSEPFKGMSDNEIWNRYVNFEENKFFNPKNRVFYENEFNPAQAPKGSNDDIGIQEMIRQYYDNNKHLPPKDELDERVHTGELVYVHDYTRADGTKVSGYYRAYPRG